MPELSSKDVSDFLIRHHLSPLLRTMPVSTHSAQDAATALNCSLGQIAKSIVFFAPNNNQPLLILVSGVNRVDKKLVSTYLGFQIKTASPEYVLSQTGFKVGGVPPFGHLYPIRTLMDAALLQYPHVWLAAGDDHTLFPLPPSVLEHLTKSETISVC